MLNLHGACLLLLNLNKFIMKGLKLLFILLSLDLALFVKDDGFVPVSDALDASLM